MIKYFYKEKNTIQLSTDLAPDKTANILWIDMINPSVEEIDLIQSNFDIIIPSKQERQEIESSSRYWEESDKIEINTFFAINQKKDSMNEEISVILFNDILISVRTGFLHSFEEFTKKFLKSKDLYKDGYEIFVAILDIRIDRDADVIENLSKEISILRKSVLKDISKKEIDILEQISDLEDFNITVQANLRDKQRILSSFMKSKKFNNVLKEEISVMLKDIHSLLEHTSFNFERLDYLKTIFIGTLSIEQNKVIKIFTIVNVIFLPPTLIASIYGMNFKLMPELHFQYGYGISIILMIISSILPIYIFKKKNLI